MSDKDIFGQAMRDYWTGLGLHVLKVRTQVVDWEDLPVSHFFRDYEHWPDLEVHAIEQCAGKVLDMGAGAGAHALRLQEVGHQVVAVDNSKGAVEVMKSRGVVNSRLSDWQNFNERNFDTVLLLMNGIGLAGTIQGLEHFTTQWDKWLKPDGQVLFESTDIAYIYDFPTGSNPLELEPYYGEQTYQMKYGSMELQFPWLFADKISLEQNLAKLGWTMEVIFDDGNGSFLVRSSRVK